MKNPENKVNPYASKAVINNNFPAPLPKSAIPGATNPDKEYVYDTRETNKYIDNPNYLYANTTHVYGNEPIIWGKQSPGDKAPEPWWPNDNDKWWHFRIGIDGHFDPNGRRYITNNKGWKKYD